MTLALDELVQRRNNGDAHGAYNMAFARLTDTRLSGIERALLMRECGLCLRSLGNYVEALAWYDRALVQAGVEDDAELTAKLHINRGVAYFRLFRFDASESAFAIAANVVPVAALETRFMLCTSRAKLYRNMGKVEAAHEQALLAAVIAQSSGDQSMLGKALVETAASYAHLGANEEALADAFEAARLLEEVNDLGPLADAYSQIYILLHGLQRNEEALTYAERAFALASTGKSELAFVMMACNLALAMTDVYHDARGLAFLAHHADRLQAITAPVALSRYFGALGQIYNELQQWPEAINALEQAMHHVGSREAWLEVNNIRFALAQAYAGAGQYDEARSEVTTSLHAFEQSGSALNKQYVFFLVFAWRLEASCGRYEESVRYAERAWAAQQSLYSENFSRLAAALHMKYRVAERERELQQMRLRAADAEQQLEQSRKELAEVALRQIERQRDDQSKSRTTIFSEADWLLFERQFDATYRNFIAELLRVCPDLSRAEQRVCTLLVLRMTSKDIAAMLSCSVRTVEWHRLRLRKKLHCGQSEDLSAMLCAMAARIAVGTTL